MPNEISNENAINFCQIYIFLEGIIFIAFVFVNRRKKVSSFFKCPFLMQYY